MERIYLSFPKATADRPVHNNSVSPCVNKRRSGCRVTTWLERIGAGTNQLSAPTHNPCFVRLVLHRPRMNQKPEQHTLSTSTWKSKNLDQKVLQFAEQASLDAVTHRISRSLGNLLDFGEYEGHGQRLGFEEQSLRVLRVLKHGFIKFSNGGRMSRTALHHGDKIEVTLFLQVVLDFFGSCLQLRQSLRWERFSDTELDAHEIRTELSTFMLARSTP